jgi:regulatory protein
VTTPRQTLDPYRLALTWLSARELTSAQLATRLRQRGCSPVAIQDAIERLKGEGALDDRRAAAAVARTAAEVKRRGPSRVTADLEQLGIDRDTAREVTAEVFGAVDEDALIARALARRLRGAVRGPAEFRRLHAYLVRQGFSSSRAVAALKARTRAGVEEDEE